MSGNYKKEKERLIAIIDELDLKAENIPLNQAKRLSLKEANEKISKLRRDEETKWAQRAKVTNIQEGRSNTRYFHVVANGKNEEENLPT
jgi:hypothetical protein